MKFYINIACSYLRQYYVAVFSSEIHFIEEILLFPKRSSITGILFIKNIVKFANLQIGLGTLTNVAFLPLCIKFHVLCFIEIMAFIKVVVLIDSHKHC